MKNTKWLLTAALIFALSGCSKQTAEEKELGIPAGMVHVTVPSDQTADNGIHAVSTDYFEVTEIDYFSGDSEAACYIKLKNIGSEPVKIFGECKAFDKDEKAVAASKLEQNYILGQGETTLVPFNFFDAVGADHFGVDLKYQKAKDACPILSKLDMDLQENAKNAVVTLKNNSEYVLRDLTVRVLFYDAEGKLIKSSIKDFAAQDLPLYPDFAASNALLCPNGYDHAEAYVSAVCNEERPKPNELAALSDKDIFARSFLLTENVKAAQECIVLTNQSEKNLSAVICAKAFDANGNLLSAQTLRMPMLCAGQSNVVKAQFPLTDQIADVTFDAVYTNLDETVCKPVLLNVMQVQDGAELTVMLGNKSNSNCMLKELHVLFFDQEGKLIGTAENPLDTVMMTEIASGTTLTRHFTCRGGAFQTAAVYANAYAVN